MLPYFNLHKSIDEGIFSHFEKDTVAEPSIEYMRQIVIRTLIRDLLGGTQTMQAAEQRWLPRNPKEKWNSYTRRLQSSILYSAFKNTVEKITSKPFSRPIIVPTIGNEQIDLIQTDADFEGTDLSPFVWDVFWDGVAYGQSHIFVDYPKVSKTINLQVQRQNKIHPYFVRIPALSLIGRRESGGQLTQIRIMTMETVEDGRFGEKEVPQVVVWNADGTWEKWRKNANGAWVVEEEGTHTFKGIPLYTFYTSRKGVLKASPPLEDLAWVNLGHWQSYSDQRNILRVTRVPIMMQTGISQEEMDKKTVIGPGNIFKSVNPDAKMFFVEHSGKSIQAGENELKKLEQWAEILGLSPFISASGVATATEVTMRESRINTSVQSWIRNMESTLENAYRGAAQWVSIRLPKDFKTDIYSEFAVSVRDPEDIRSLDLARARLDITGETFIKEQKRRGILSEDIDPGKEASAALEEKKEGLALSAQNGTPEKGRPPQTVRSNQLETKPNTQPTLQFQRK